MATVRLQLRRGTAQQWEDADPTLAAGEIGIETDTNTFKFGDGNTPWTQLSYALSDTVDDYVLLSTKGQPLGVASLDASGYVPAAQLPPLAKVTVSAVADQAGRLGLTAEPGDIAIQSDTGTTYVLSSSPASTNGNWREISATAAISAAITAHESDTTNVHGIADTSALALSATVASDISSAVSTHNSDTTNVHGIADTSILATTTGIQTLTNKTITAPLGLEKADVGLANVDNTSDLDKPISTLTLQALGAKAPLNSPALTGDATANNLTISGNLTVNGTTSTINSTTLTVQDKDIVLGQVENPTDAAANDGGIILKGTTDKSIKYSLSKSAWDVSENINIPGDKAVKINNIEVLTINTVLGKSLPGVVVGTTESQTLTNKTLESPAVTGTVAMPTNTSIGDVSANEIALLVGLNSNVQDQIDSKAPSESPAFTGTVTGITKAMVGLTSVDDTADLDKPISTATQSALDFKADLASPTFTGTVVLPSDTSIGDVSSSEIALLDGVSSNVQDQIDAKAPSASPTFTGTVVLPSSTSIGDVSSSEIALLGGITSNIQDQIDAKAPSESPTFTGTVTLPANTISQSQMSNDSVGTDEIIDSSVTTGKIVDSAVTTDKIANAAVTTDKIANDSITTGKIASGTIIDSDISASAAIAQSKISGLADSFDLKAPIANPTFTGTVSGITKSMVGLANVDNTSDADKPVSTAAQTALDAKASLAGATFTGNVEVDGNLVVDGDLTVNGTNFAASATSITIEDNMVQLAHQNSANTVDLGIVVGYNDGSAKHAGLVRDVSDAKWKLFKGVTTEPSTTVDFTQGSLDDLKVAAFEATTVTPSEGVVFSDGTQTKVGVPSLTTIGTEISADYNLSTGGLVLRDQLIPIAGTRAITVPTNATTAFPVGTSIDFYQASGTGANFVEASGVTILRTPGLKLRTTYSSATLTKVATNTWLLAGDLSA